MSLRSPLARLGVAVELGAAPQCHYGFQPHRAARRPAEYAGRRADSGDAAEGDPSGLTTEMVRLDELVRVIGTTSISRRTGGGVALDVDTCEDGRGWQSGTAAAGY